jgi:DNA-binding beta-propeller fold protein YncE
MVRSKIKYLWLLVLLISCKHEPYVAAGNYPKDVGDIILNKCATSGCHNNASYSAAGGLNLTSWDNLFKGGNGGAAVIPYRTDFSTLCFYTNTDTNLGVTLTPTMPANMQPLSTKEYVTLASWIATGASDANGKVAFSENPNRKKMYVANRLCDAVTVIDEASFLQMRYIDIGTNSGQEFANNIQVSPDKKNWYVSFSATSLVVQKFDATNDVHIADIPLGAGSWLSFVITKDSKYSYFADNSNPGRVVYVDLMNNKILATYSFDNKFMYPQGMALNEQVNKLYIGASMGNFIYSIDISNPLQPIIKQTPIDDSSVILTNSSIDPITMQTTENNLCYIACQKTKEIRVLDMSTDKLVAIIKLPDAPQSLTYSKSTHKVLVACPNDSSSFPGNRGSIIVIDANTNTIIKHIKSGYEPYSIAADDESGIAIVANANLHMGGPAPHHVSKCGGRNGNVSFINLHTLELIQGKKSEVATFPYSVSTR